MLHAAHSNIKHSGNGSLFPQRSDIISGLYEKNIPPISIDWKTTSSFVTQPKPNKHLILWSEKSPPPHEGLRKWHKVNVCVYPAQM